MDRRSFLKTAAVTGAVAAAGMTTGGLAAAPASAGPISVARYRLQVPEIFKPLADAPSFTDTIVIGSGFGGAVSAYRLAKAGVSVTVLERGSRWPRGYRRNIFPTDILPDGRGFWRRTRFTGVDGLPQFIDYFGGVFDATDYANIQVWRGAAVGGGSMVYTGATVEPEQRFFEHVFAGTGVDYASMHNTYYPRARTNLAVSPMPDDIYNNQAFTHSRLWDAQSRKAGYSPQIIDGIWQWNVVRDEISGKSDPSAIIGCSNLGNSNGVKFDLRQNYLKWAEDTGKATIYPGHEVTSIGRDSNNQYAVTVDKVAPTGEVLSTRTISCAKLFLGGGSIGTSELLVKARATGTLPDLNEHIGEGWGTNGDAAVTRKLTLGGLTQGAPSRSRILDETGMPVSFENWYVPGIPVDLGIIGSLGMALDDTRGRFAYDAATEKVDLSWPGQNDAILAMRAVNDKIADANKMSTGFGPLAPDINSRFTAHPLGGAVIGRASDSFGRVKGYDGLYVMDGAGIPGSTGTANPSLTITALAERNIEAIISAGR